ncbi:DUF6263 family protein [Paraflavitalea pollutisoli]|uniref:DUF6263 family protein n=1 Tax=Paraflavitalea pollutisoli TaxID=3034143 RepID=UPI0023ECEB78|nr:DUF6263 family protein [Paraflavitalea sp. H1-2-19X]
MKKLLFIPLFLSVFAVSAQSLSRKVVLKQGQQVERVAAIKMNIGMEMMGQSIDINNDNTVTSLVEVKGASGTAYDLASTVKRVVTNMKGMGQEMSYDTDKKDAAAANDMTKKADELVGKTNNLTIDSKGVITKSDDTGGDDKEKASGFMGMSGGVLNAGQKVGAIFDLVAKLPDHPVKVGDSWTDSTISKEGKVHTKYKVLEIKNDEAIIDMEGTLTQAGQVENNGMTIDMNLAGTSKGQLSMETASGLVRKLTMALNATGTMEVMGNSIPFTMKIDMDQNATKK